MYYSPKYRVNESDTGKKKKKGFLYYNPKARKGDYP
jgi:hypothetical protein